MEKQVCIHLVQVTPPSMFCPWLVESAEVEPMDKED